VSRVYDIGCGSRIVNPGSTGNQVLSGSRTFEDCIQQCNLPANTGTCIGAYWKQTTQRTSGYLGTCTLCTANGDNTDNPAQLVGGGLGTGIDDFRVARLLTPSKPRVNDAIWYMAADRTQSLNLCTNGNYDGSFVNTQQRLGPFRTGTTMHWLVTCGGQHYANVGTSTAIDVATQWQTRNGGDLTLTPQNADDCQRLCGWHYQENADASNSNAGCQAWIWTGTSNTAGTCYMYTRRNGTPLVLTSAAPPGGISGSIWAAGGWAQGITQVNNLNSWKRSINPGEQAGRYKRSIWIQEREEDWAKPDLILTVRNETLY
jgi:hypothetical protein